MSTGTPHSASVAVSRDEAQAIVRAVWMEVLGNDAAAGPGLEDDFFEIGGTSLSLITVVAKLSERFGVELPTAVVVDGATIAALANSVLEKLAAAEAGSPGKPVAMTAA